MCQLCNLIHITNIDRYLNNLQIIRCTRHRHQMTHGISNSRKVLDSISKLLTVFSICIVMLSLKIALPTHFWIWRILLKIWTTSAEWWPMDLCKYQKIIKIHVLSSKYNFYEFLKHFFMQKILLLSPSKLFEFKVPVACASEWVERISFAKSSSTQGFL